MVCHDMKCLLYLMFKNWLNVSRLFIKMSYIMLIFINKRFKWVPFLARLRQRKLFLRAYGRLSSIAGGRSGFAPFGSGYRMSLDWRLGLGEMQISIAILAMIGW